MTLAILALAMAALAVCAVTVALAPPHQYPGTPADFTR